MRQRRLILVCLLLVSIVYSYYWRYTNDTTTNLLNDAKSKTYVAYERHAKSINDFIRTCGLNEEPTVTRTIPSLPNIKEINPLNNQVAKDLCVKTIKERPLFPLTLKEILNMEDCMKYNENPEKLESYSWHFFYDLSGVFFQNINRNPESIIIEIGGYVGNQAKKLAKQNVQTYVVVEPIKKYYDQLTSNMKSYEGKSTFHFFNFGLGKQYSKVAINDDDVRTSLFNLNKNTPSKTIDVFNVIDFFAYLGVSCVDIQLLSINCEGCEFEVIEELATTSLIEKVVNIQFQPHYVYTNVGNYSCRYCRLIELLSRTHELSYRFNVIWEMWRRKYGI